MNIKKSLILGVFLALTFTFTGSVLAYQPIQAADVMYPPQPGAEFGNIAGAKSYPPTFNLFKTYGLSQEYLAWGPVQNYVEERQQGLNECYGLLYADYPHLAGPTFRSMQCFLMDYCDKFPKDGVPTEEELLRPFGDCNGTGWGWRHYNGCVCGSYHDGFIDGAEEDDLLLYPIGGNTPSPTAVADVQEVISAFFLTVWPQYGAYNPFHIAYCTSDYLTEDSNLVEWIDIEDYHTICDEIYDNRSNLDLNTWATHCQQGETGGLLNCLINPSDCCCTLEWIDGLNNVANGMRTMDGTYTKVVKRSDNRLSFYSMPHYGDNDLENPYFEEYQIPAGVVYGPEHNYGTLYTYEVTSPTRKSTCRNNMGSAVAANHDYNFSGYTQYVPQSGCSQTIADTCELTTCQGYDGTDLSSCEVGYLLSILEGAFESFCMSIDKITEQGTDYCLDRSKSSFCDRMAKEILHGFMGTNTTTHTEYIEVLGQQIPITVKDAPVARSISNVTSPADIWSRLWGTPSDICGPGAVDPASFYCAGERCLCTGEAYCWCNTEYDYWCPLEWYDGCDGCDQGCQFTDPDCWDPTGCAYWSSSYGKNQCGNDRCDPGEDSSNCFQDCGPDLGGGCNGQSQCGWSFCCSSSPCLEGGGDCDSDAECASGLICGTDNGADAGCDPIADLCVAPLFDCPCDSTCDYCWCDHSTYAGNCPTSWNGTSDGCDCGCQFEDPDCDGGSSGGGY
jgi:hypothetical protein